MLFQIPESKPEKLVAYMINKPDSPPGSMPSTMAAAAESQEHAHYHRTEIQILTGAEAGPEVLKPGATLNIITGEKGVTLRSSFEAHIPNLQTVIDRAPAFRDLKRRDTLDETLIQNVITVDGGIVRARNVATWDQGGYPLTKDRADPRGYPLSKDPNDIGAQPDLLAILKFMGSTVQGHMATDVVVEISDSESVELECKPDDDRFDGKRNASTSPNPHVPPGTVEILVSNYEAPTEKPTPWGLDFQWLFQAAGYPPADLSKSDDSEFEKWVEAATAYDKELFENEWRVFFGGQDRTIGLPFPYLLDANGLTALTPLTPLRPLTRPLNVFACKGGVIP
jgi:hypothetical protein